MKVRKEITMTVMAPVVVTLTITYAPDEYGEVEEFDIERVKEAYASHLTPEGVFEHMSEEDHDHVLGKIQQT